jgi:hypothetical protein
LEKILPTLVTLLASQIAVQTFYPMYKLVRIKIFFEVNSKLKVKNTQDSKYVPFEVV